MDIEMSEWFIDRFKKRKNKHVKDEALDAIALFRKDPYDSNLELEPLFGDLEGFCEISVNEDYRIILELKKRKAIFVNFGTHDQLYYLSYPEKKAEHPYSYQYSGEDKKPKKIKKDWRKKKR